MADQTNIEWCDSTFNPWMGCTKVSPACDHCYAERDTRRFGRVEWGADKPRVRTSAANWKLPERLNREEFCECPSCHWRGPERECVWDNEQCPQCGQIVETARRRIFCASLADWLDNEAPIEWLVDLLDLIRRTPNLDWLLLTKRIGTWHDRLVAAHDYGAAHGAGDDLLVWIDWWLAGLDIPANVWIGATVVNQPEADRDIPKLLRVPARVRFLSIEPMLGPVNLNQWLLSEHGRRHIGAQPGIGWIICGGESGPHARPMHPDWVRGLRDQCAAAGVPFLFKQWGEWANQHAAGLDESICYEKSSKGGWIEPTGEWQEGELAAPRSHAAEHIFHVGKKLAGRLLDGVEHNGHPKPLLV
ncbi:MAG: phage Gp37/Gp68 family protein [Nevskiaceae bacterium]|nr:MAG: phage Gp37/Gp68 family protein [Nevskiaceae bacterium]